MDLCPYETESTIRLHRQELLSEAKREQLLTTRPVQSTWIERILSRTGRRLIQIGTWLETRYTEPVLSADYAD
jgi:hypothetical protein